MVMPPAPSRLAFQEPHGEASSLSWKAVRRPHGEPVEPRGLTQRNFIITTQLCSCATKSSPRRLKIVIKQGFTASSHNADRYLANNRATCLNADVSTGGSRRYGRRRRLDCSYHHRWPCGLDCIQLHEKRHRHLHERHSRHHWCGDCQLPFWTAGGFVRRLDRLPRGRVHWRLHPHWRRSRDTRLTAHHRSKRSPMQS